MKILHLCGGSLNGGAAKGMISLHHALIELGINSKILIQYGNKSKNVSSLSSNFLKRVKQLVLNHSNNLYLLKYKKKQIFSAPFFGNKITKTKEYKWADVIHIHWLNNSLISLEELSKIDKPIIWTLRDMWPFTGGCHYTNGCQKYKNKCGKCPLLSSNFDNDLSHTFFLKKEKLYPKFNAVAISNWIKSEAEKSSLTKDVIMISNCINTKKFNPYDKIKSKKELGIPANKKNILLGATNILDAYKGVSQFKNSLKYFDKNKYFFTFFGNKITKPLDELNINYKHFGNINSEGLLSMLYSSADVFVAPSIQEAFGKTLVESMSCETPVVCFDATGPKDIVKHKKTGYKAKPFDSKDLANGIEWVLTNNRNNILGKNARKDVIERFDSKVIAKKYIELYKKVLN